MDGELNISALLAGQHGEQGGHLLDAMFPPDSAHDAALIHGTGICPVNASLVDTRTVNGVALAALDLDPLTTAWLSRLG